MLDPPPSRNIDARGHRLPLGRRALVMGIVNVTPDSFSDGGRYFDPAVALSHAQRLAEEGADILDIGAESTRPYGDPVQVELGEELRRLADILPRAVELGLPVSIDTIKAKTAAWALEKGALIVNDVWGLQRDADMARVAADHAAAVVVMHNRDKVDPAIDIMADIRDFFSRSLEIAARAGVGRNRIALDPGIGFGKTPAQSITAIARLGELREFGLPLLMGLSRKRFIDSISPAPPDRRLGGTIAGNLLAVLAGAEIVRVHDVADTVQALRVADAIRSAG